VKKLPILCLPIYELKLKTVEEKTHIFDVVRKKYLLLTPEEWVRQNFINYLNKEKNYPLGLMGVEQMVKYNSLKTRADIVLYNTEGKANIIVECKSPEVKITQDAFNQIAKYNSQLKVKYLIVTNGMKHYCCKMDYETNEITFLEEIPVY
jgi:type I site-specific restriction endonuclease